MLTGIKRERNNCESFWSAVNPLSSDELDVWFAMNDFLALRSNAHLSPAEVSELLGISTDRIAAYERGEIKPSSREIQVLKGILMATGSKNKAPHSLAQYSSLPTPNPNHNIKRGSRDSTKIYEPTFPEQDACTPAGLKRAQQHQKMAIDWNTLAKEFHDILGIRPPDDLAFRKRVEAVLSRLSACNAVPTDERRTRLLALVNRKFDINAQAINKLLAIAAAKKISFNYHEKSRIAAAFDQSEKPSFTLVLQLKNAVDDDLVSAFRPASVEVTLKKLHSELVSPTLIRKDSRPRDWSQEIRRSLFGGFVFSVFRQQDMHELFDKDIHLEARYEPDFWKHLHKSRREMFSRAKTLVYLECDGSIEINKIAPSLQKEFFELANHGYFALHLKNAHGREWRTAALATLFAEKFLEKRLENGYFRWREIESTTRSYIPALADADTAFDRANLGYHYKDTFVLGDDARGGILLLFQKNTSDETLIPCPSCRSHDVQGNSYSSLGVKSWECMNPICPDRSKFDRGKRYSFYQLLRQQAIDNTNAMISISSVRAWSRDVQSVKPSDAIIEMLVRHYTLPGDGVLQIGGDVTQSLGRDITCEQLSKYLNGLNELGENALSKFSRSPFFGRFAIARPTPGAGKGAVESRTFGNTELLLGDCFDVLSEMPEAIFDGAVTSPPYYNAREYAQWQNIYCYLYDMFNIARQVFRTLKPGATYLFNIFDYFDNENTIAYSAMGDKRMILSAYCVELFERAGFKCEGNIVWDKGEIEGKRAFNNGNFSPYYQAPFNCWEHILIFKKPGGEISFARPLPRVLRQKPVMKIVQGVNCHGHTAPFPDQVPELLLERLPENSVVLDPFAGSMTTGRVAARLGRRAVCIEKDRAYFELGFSMLRNSAAQIPLFHLAAQ